MISNRLGVLTCTSLWWLLTLFVTFNAVWVHGLHAEIPMGTSPDNYTARQEAGLTKLSSLVGQRVHNGKYALTTLLPVPSARKCQIYEAYRTEDVESRDQPLVVKLSSNLQGIDWEYYNYQLLSERLTPEERKAFVEVYDKIPTLTIADLGNPETDPTPRAGIAMEMGYENLRFQVRNKGAFRGERLREAMQDIISIVNTLHVNGMVWTELKAENFVTTSHSGGGAIKGIDLESVILTGDLLRCYTAEACPPEFPVEELYRSLPTMTMHPAFDMWGLGLVLFEIATGKPLYKNGITDLEYIKNQLRAAPATIQQANTELLKVHPQARGIISGCLQIDPDLRPSCQDLLNDPYFGGRSTNV